MSDHAITITVTYTGRDDFSHAYQGGGVPVGTVKIQAMHFFGLEAGAKDAYELVQNNLPLEDDVHIRDLGPSPIKLTLRRKDPVNKGVE